MNIYKTLAGAKAMVDLGYDSSYFRFVHVVARDKCFLTCWSDETLYIPKSGKVLWTGWRETGVNTEGAWIRVIRWTRADGVNVEREVISNQDIITLMGADDENEFELEEEIVA